MTMQATRYPSFIRNPYLKTVRLHLHAGIPGPNSTADLLVSTNNALDDMQVRSNTNYLITGVGLGTVML